MTDRDTKEPNFVRREITTQAVGFAPKTREIYVPTENTRGWHDNVLQFMYATDFLDTSHLPGHVWVDGAMPDTTIMDGVLPHKDNWTFYKMDLKNAFPSVRLPLLRDRMNQRMDELNLAPGYRRYLTYFLDEYATTPEVSGLPLGAPCSPALFNLYCREMDEHMAAFAEDFHLTYTRYLDDIVLSSPYKERTLGEDTRRFAREIIDRTLILDRVGDALSDEERADIERDPGMKINYAKTRLLRRQEHHVTITGVAIYPDGRIQPEPRTMQKIFAIFDEIEEKVIRSAVDPSVIIDEYDLSVLQGYHGTLVSMSQEPYNRTMKEAFRRYRSTAHLVKAALAQQENPDYVRSKPSPEAVAEMERLLTGALFGDPEAIQTLSGAVPGVWKALLKKGMIHSPPPKKLLSPQDLSGTMGPEGTYIF